MLRRTLSIVLFVAAAAAAQTTYPVQVQVTDPTGAFVPSVSISASVPTDKKPTTVKTDANGMAVLRLAAGPCTITARAPGFRSTQEKILVSRPTTILVPLQIEMYNGPVMVVPGAPIPTESLSHEALIPETPLDQCSCTRARHSRHRRAHSSGPGS